MSAEIPNSQGHAVVRAEANMWVYRYGEISHTAAASVRTVHVIQLRSVNWREPVFSIWRSVPRWYVCRPERENDKRNTGSRMAE